MEYWVYPLKGAHSSALFAKNQPIKKQYRYC